jgi:hypothetical protein
MGGGWSMRTFLLAAVGFPTFLFTTALVVVVVFWLLVAVGVTTSDSFDADVDLAAWGMGGVPVAVAFSLLTAFAWFLSLGATVLLDPVVPPGSVRVLTSLVVLFAALVVAWGLTRRCVRPLRRSLPDEPGASRPDFAGPTRTIRTGRMDDGAAQAEMAARDGCSALAQVHRAGTDRLAKASSGLLDTSDEARELFRLRDTGRDPRGHAA